jgi:4a-hydroxytetrahydrobiopterin dehydratase
MVDGWNIIKDKKDIYFLEKQFSFKNFLDSQKFVNAVGKISEEEGHHPEITFGWGYAKINITTHAIEGLSENDFILAAKIDKI